MERENKKQEKKLKVVKMLLEKKHQQEKLKRRQSASKASKRQSSKKGKRQKNSSQRLNPIRNYANAILEDYILNPQTKKLFKENTRSKFFMFFKRRQEVYLDKDKG